MIMIIIITILLNYNSFNLLISFNGRVVSIVDHHQDYMITKSNYRLSLGTNIGSCSTLIGKIVSLYSRGFTSFFFIL